MELPALKVGKPRPTPVVRGGITVPKIVLKYGKAIPGYLSRYIEDKEDLYDFCNVEENILEF